MRKWTPYILAALLALAILWVLDARRMASDAMERATAWEDSARVAQTDRAAAQLARQDAEVALEAAVERTRAAEASALSANARARAASVAWERLPETATAAEVRDVAEAVIEQHRTASEAWRQAYLRSQRALASSNEVNRTLRVEMEALDRQVVALTQANAALHEEVNRGVSVVPVVALTAAGAGIGYAVDGGSGALRGSGIGLALGLVREGIKALTRARLPWPL